MSIEYLPIFANCHAICELQVPAFLSSISSKLSSWQVQGIIFLKKKSISSKDFFFANFNFWCSVPLPLRGDRQAGGGGGHRCLLSQVLENCLDLLTYWPIENCLYLLLPLCSSPSLRWLMTMLVLKMFSASSITVYHSSTLFRKCLRYPPTHIKILFIFINIIYLYKK